MDPLPTPSSAGPSSVLLRIRSGVALAVIVGVPLVWSFQLTLDFYNRPKLAFLVAATALLGGLSLVASPPGARFRAWRRMAVPVTAILLPLTISWLASPYKEWAVLGLYGRLQGLLPYVVIALFALLAAEVVSREPSRIATALATSGGVAGLYSLVQAGGLDPFVYDSIYQLTSGLWTAQSTLGNTNFAGAFFAVVMPIALAMVLVDRRHRVAFPILLGLTVIGLVTSVSEASWIAALGGTTVATGYWLRSRWRHAPIGGFVVAAAIAILLVGTVVAAGTAEADPTDGLDTLESRYWGWHSAIAMASDYPVLGRGPNSYAVEAVRYNDPSIVGRGAVPDDPHSVPLAYLTSAGVPGLVGYLIFVAWGLRAGIRAARRDESLLAAGLLGAFVSYCLVGLVTLDEITLRVVVWALLVALVGLHPTPYEPRRPGPGFSWRRKMPAVALAGLIVIGGWWVAARTLYTDRQMLRGVNLALDNDAPGAVAVFRSGLGFWDEYRYREIAGQRVGELGTRRGPEGADLITEMRHLFSYLDGFPDARGMVTQARLLHVWADRIHDPAVDEDALALYERARILDPHHPVLVTETAQVLVALGRTEDAIRLLESFAPREPRFGSFWAVLALQYEATGRHTDALVAIEKGLEIKPQTATVLEAAEILEVPIGH